jgi:CubicO group peptidase (beta-lactamase class C family)
MSRIGSGCRHDRTARARFVLLAAILFLMAAVAAPAQPADDFRDVTPIPDTPAFRRAQELVAAVNANDPERLRAYLTEAIAPSFLQAIPLQDHLRILQAFYLQTGGLEIHSARLYDPPRPGTNAVLIARARSTETWVALVVDVDAAPPRRIVGAQLLPARPPRDLPSSPRLTDEEIVRELRAYIDRLVARAAFSGTVLLAKNGRVLMTHATGIANRDFNAPVDLQTKFNLGSMNKMLTAVAIAQLAGQGKLSFDDPIGKFLGADWLDPKILAEVTIHQLLTHTSGLGSYFNERYERSSRLLFREVNDYRPLVLGDTLAFPPGSAWQYSNTGFLLLGAIVEKASGENYFDYVREHVTGPTGMTHTDCYELDRVNPNLAVGYDPMYGSAGIAYRNNIFDHVLRGGPAGGGYSTVEDLLRFDQALRGGRLLSPEILARVWRAYPEWNSPSYGYGFGVDSTAAGRRVGHSGGFTGISAHLSMYLDTGYTVAVLSNLSGGAPPVHAKACQLIEQGR